MSAASVYAIAHDAVARRLSAVVDAETCELDYVLQGQVMVIVHTGVPAAVGGRGIAASLVQAAFELAEREGWRVRPACSYAAVWVRRHPEYARLLAE